MSRTVLFASTNPHKLEEVRAILEPHGIGVLGLDDVRMVAGQRGSDLPEPAEDAATFEGNASIKAAYYARMTGAACLADDSGLEVDALDGAPGVHSARYAGVGKTRKERDAANNAKLLRALDGVPRDKRTGRFVCAMVLAEPTGAIAAMARGTFEGWIGLEPRGANGFGYDPLVVLADGRTSAELTEAEKNARSHRGEAARKMVEFLKR